MLAPAPCDDDDAAAALDMRATGIDHLVTQHRAKLGQMTASLLIATTSALHRLSVRSCRLSESRTAMRAKSPRLSPWRQCCSQLLLSMTLYGLSARLENKSKKWTEGLQGEDDPPRSASCLKAKSQPKAPSATAFPRKGQGNTPSDNSVAPNNYTLANARLQQLATSPR